VEKVMTMPRKLITEVETLSELRLTLLSMYENSFFPSFPCFEGIKLGL
jgi:hypothetical protein